MAYLLRMNSEYNVTGPDSKIRSSILRIGCKGETQVPVVFQRKMQKHLQERKKINLDIRLYILTWAHGLSFISPSTFSNPPTPSKFLKTKLYYPNINRHTRHH
jgi:hypothetical protein